jgi:hypothetical protein
MNISYNSSVYTKAGWRHVSIEAEAEQISAGMARILRVIKIDGEDPRGTLSRTGARRQEYWADSVARREVGARKRLSTCVIH